MQAISTNNLYTSTITDALTVQSQLAAVTTQEASGLEAQSFGALGGSSSREMLNLETDIAQAQNWSSQAQTVGSTTQAMYTAVGTMSSSVTQLQSLISQAMSSPNNSDLLNQAESIQQTLLSQMNQQVGGTYIFAGSNTSEAPVDMSKYPTISASTNGYDPSQADTSYYTGDNQILSVRVNLQQTVSYGVTANNPAMEQALRAVESVVQAAQVSTNSTATASSASVPTSVGGGTLTVNGQNYTITGGQSLTQIAQSINAQTNGSGVAASVVADSNGQYHLQLTDGMNAMTITDNSGLGLASASPLPTKTLTDSLQSSLTLANQSAVSLDNLQQDISNSSNELSSAATQQTSFVTYLQNSLSSIKDVDSAQAATQAQQYQTQLQASYMAISSLTKMNLAQYL